jgi:hypothetical protein
MLHFFRYGTCRLQIPEMMADESVFFFFYFVTLPRLPRKSCFGVNPILLYYNTKVSFPLFAKKKIKPFHQLEVCLIEFRKHFSIERRTMNNRHENAFSENQF